MREVTPHRFASSPGLGLYCGACGNVELNPIHEVTGSAVDHPVHYGGADDPHEHVKCAEAWGLFDNAMLYNATKYLRRLGKKGSALEDLRKAIWYLQRYEQYLVKKASE